jgi:hypothetical protein
MGIFKKIFGSKSNPEPLKSHQLGNPDNTRLIFLLNNYIKNRGNENYKLVVDELLNGNSFLMLPSINDETASKEWTVSKENTSLKLTTIFNLDGLKVLGAFTDSEAVYTWAKKSTPYTSVKSQAVLEMCKEMDISRIVINSDSPNMFVIERERNMQELNISANSTVMIGTPNRPLDELIISNLRSNFEKIENIIEAYQYMQTQNNQANITIGIKLSNYNDNARKAAINAVQNAITHLPKETYLDVFFLEKSDWYDRVKKVEGSLFYKKSF